MSLAGHLSSDELVIKPGGVYQGKTIAWTWPFNSQTNPDRSYRCLLFEDGSLTCNCPGWAKRVVNGVRECKHTQFVASSLEMVQNGGAFVESMAPAQKAMFVTAKDNWSRSRRRFNFD